MVDRISQSKKSKGENNTGYIHGNERAGNTELRIPEAGA